MGMEVFGAGDHGTERISGQVQKITANTWEYSDYSKKRTRTCTHTHDRLVRACPVTDATRFTVAEWFLFTYVRRRTRTSYMVRTSYVVRPTPYVVLVRRLTHCTLLLLLLHYTLLY